MPLYTTTEGIVLSYVSNSYREFIEIYGPYIENSVGVVKPEKSNVATFVCRTWGMWVSDLSVRFGRTIPVLFLNFFSKTPI